MSSEAGHNHEVTVPGVTSSWEKDHIHNIYISTAGAKKNENNLPPYYKLAYIMKVK